MGVMKDRIYITYYWKYIMLAHKPILELKKIDQTLPSRPVLVTGQTRLMSSWCKQRKRWYWFALLDTSQRLLKVQIWMIVQNKGNKHYWKKVQWFKKKSTKNFQENYIFGNFRQKVLTAKINNFFIGIDSVCFKTYSKRKYQFWTFSLFEIFSAI